MTIGIKKLAFDCFYASLRLIIARDTLVVLPTAPLRLFKMSLTIHFWGGNCLTGAGGCGKAGCDRK